MIGTIIVLALLGGALPSDSTKRPGTIVFSSDRSGAWRIWSMNLDGSKRTQLTRHTGKAGDVKDVDPMISPDGKSLLFTSTRGGAPGVWRTPLAALKLERICPGDQAEWSPDGRRIVLRRKGRIVQRELKSGKETVLAPEDWRKASGPAWSPDGKTIAFACRWDGGNGLFTVTASGGTPKAVYNKRGACEPHWSPDGALLVYETETHIGTIKPDGTGNRLVTYHGGVQRYGRFSPDGKNIIFCQAPSPRGPWELYLIPARGGVPRKLTEDGSDMHPHWK